MPVIIIITPPRVVFRFHFHPRTCKERLGKLRWNYKSDFNPPRKWKNFPSRWTFIFALLFRALKTCLDVSRKNAKRNLCEFKHWQQTAKHRNSKRYRINEQRQLNSIFAVVSSAFPSATYGNFAPIINISTPWIFKINKMYKYPTHSPTVGDPHPCLTTIPPHSLYGAVSFFHSWNIK